jgi:membrane-bound ClpP family serine protease
MMRQGARSHADANASPELWAWLLETVAVAEIAFLLTTGGALLSVAWLAAPRVVALAAGAVPLLAGGVLGLAELPVAPAAALLLVLALGSLVMEVLAAPGLLLHAVGGGVALAMGGLCLHEPGSGAHPGLVLPTSAGVALVTWTAGRRSWRAVREDPLASATTLTGCTGIVLEVHDPEGRTGSAVVAGRIAPVCCLDHSLMPGRPVRVCDDHGDVLVVTPLS